MLLIYSFKNKWLNRSIVKLQGAGGESRRVCDAIGRKMLRTNEYYCTKLVRWGKIDGKIRCYCFVLAPQHMHGDGAGAGEYRTIPIQDLGTDGMRAAFQVLQLKFSGVAFLMNGPIDQYGITVPGVRIQRRLGGQFNVEDPAVGADAFVVANVHDGDRAVSRDRLAFLRFLLGSRSRRWFELGNRGWRFGVVFQRRFRHVHGLIARFLRYVGIAQEVAFLVDPFVYRGLSRSCEERQKKQTNIEFFHTAKRSQFY